MSDSLEAIIGAIYLDGGLKYAQKFILNVWKTYLDKSIITLVDSKTQLQEYSLKKFKVLPKSLESLCSSFQVNKTDEVYFVIWTTTPWTLPSNQFAAVKSDLTYVVVRFEDDPEHEYVLAEPLAASLAEKKKTKFEILDSCPGSDLVGLCYQPPFDCFYSNSEPKAAPLKNGGDAPVAWRVIEADFVTTDSGTGIVHIAPAFGEVDYSVLMAERERFENNQPPLINCVAPDGTFTDEFPTMTGRFVKECDRDLTRDVRSRGLLVHQEQYLHDYPFCWRADNDPLIQYPRASWFIRTSDFRDEMLANNSQINWIPEHIKEGRFGNFLKNNPAGLTQTITK